MSVIKRISDLVRSNVNDVLDRAEDPRKILDQTILDMQTEHKKAKKMLLETMTLLKTAEKQTEKYEAASHEWEQKAMAALKGGNEELARSALTEKQKAADLAVEARDGVEGQRKYVDELKAQLGALDSKIEEAKKKRDELIARMQAAEMKKKQVDARTGDGPGTDYVNESNAFDTFNRMVDKIENSEAEVAARAELMGDHDPVAELELQKTLEAHSADEALAALKAKMGSSDSAIPAAAPTPAADDGKSDAIEDELAKLRAKLDGG